MRKHLKIYIALAFCITLAGCGVRPAEETPEKSQLSFYKDYFLVKAIHHAFDNNPVFEKDISLPIYNEWTNYVVTTSHGKKLDSLAKAVVDSIKPSPVQDYEGAKPIFVKCLDYYNSKEFDQEVRKILKSPKVPL